LLYFLEFVLVGCHDSDRRSDFGRFSLGHDDSCQNAVGIGLEVHIGFVCLDFEENFAPFDLVAGMLVPSRDSAAVHGVG
jgi:hypothetical protein